MPVWRSRKFLTLCADTLFSLVTLGLTAFLAPDKLEFALSVVGIIQPLAIAVVVMWGVEDAAAKRAGIWPLTR